MRSGRVMEIALADDLRNTQPRWTKISALPRRNKGKSRLQSGRIVS
jgi:hypothetical protein